MPASPVDRIPDELLQVGLLLSEGSKGRLALHDTSALRIQLDLAQRRLHGSSQVVLKLALILHKVRLHHHWNEEDRAADSGASANLRWVKSEKQAARLCAPGQRKQSGCTCAPRSDFWCCFLQL